MSNAAHDPLTYTALALQTECRSVTGCSGREESARRMRDTIVRIGNQIRGAKEFIGPDTRLVVLPEYVLTGFPRGESVGAWKALATLDIGGPEYDLLGEVAQSNGVFLAGNAYENDPNFPDLYFQTCFVISPQGDVILRYRRLVSLYTPSPYDVWDRYLDVYGIDGVFPVVQTEIGNVAAIASEEILYPEIMRCLVMRGAEVFVHPTSESGSPQLTQKDVARRARAMENMVFLISANTAAIRNIASAPESTNGMSKVVDYLGHVLAEAGYGESMVAHALIDIGALRRYRRRPGMFNVLSRQPFQAYAESYAKHRFLDANGLDQANQSVPDLMRSYFLERQHAVIDRLAAEGKI